MVNSLHYVIKTRHLKRSFHILPHLYPCYSGPLSLSMGFKIQKISFSLHAEWESFWNLPSFPTHPKRSSLSNGVSGVDYNSNVLQLSKPSGITGRTSVLAALLGLTSNSPYNQDIFKQKKKRKAVRIENVAVRAVLQKDLFAHAR